mgnify:CR=1 FL=1
MELGFRYFLKQPFFKKIIIINIIVFLLPLVLNTFLFLFNLKQFSLIDYFDLHPGIGDIIKSPWTLISYSFFHIDFFHIFWTDLTDHGIMIQKFSKADLHLSASNNGPGW